FAHERDDFLLVVVRRPVSGDCVETGLRRARSTPRPMAHLGGRHDAFGHRHFGILQMVCPVWLDCLGSTPDAALDPGEPAAVARGLCTSVATTHGPGGSTPDPISSRAYGGSDRGLSQFPRDGVSSLRLDDPGVARVRE